MLNEARIAVPHVVVRIGDLIRLHGTQVQFSAKFLKSYLCVFILQYPPNAILNIPTIFKRYTGQ